jgi:hypothetical protein
MGGLIDDLEQDIAGQDVDVCNEAQLLALLSDVRKAQRLLDGLVARIGRRAEELEAESGGVLATDLLRGGGSVSARQAERERRRSRALHSAPLLRGLLSNGATSAEHVDAFALLTHRLDAEHLARLDHGQVADWAAGLPVETFRRRLRRAIIASASPAEEVEQADKARNESEFRHWFDHDSGLGHFAGSLDPERYEALTGAIERRTRELASASPTTQRLGAQLAAEALVDLVTGTARSGRSPAAITVVVSADAGLSGPAPAIRQTENGHALIAEAVDRLACDALLRRVALDERQVPIAVGRRHRTATDAQWAALKAIHASCAWEGCEAPISWCQAHHIQPWNEGGLTDLDNLVPLCSRHHQAVHEGRWSIKLLPDRSLDIFRPDGRHFATVPTPQRC